jgi:diadenosine tetraphosphate (Ap4A) HIT family hydrolase
MTTTPPSSMPTAATSSLPTLYITTHVNYHCHILPRHQDDTINVDCHCHIIAAYVNDGKNKSEGRQEGRMGTKAVREVKQEG